MSKINETALIATVALAALVTTHHAKADNFATNEQKTYNNQQIETNYNQKDMRSGDGSFNNKTEYHNIDNSEKNTTTIQNIENNQRSSIDQSVVKTDVNIHDNYNGTNAGGGDITAKGGAGGESTSASKSSANVGDINSVGTGGNAVSTSQGGTSSQGQSIKTGAVSTVVAPSYINNQVHQVPMAWSPNMAMSASQENCNNSASLGVSAGFGAISGGVPINDDDCTRRRDAILWANLGQMRIACERMIQDSGNADAMQAAGATCASLTAVQVAPLVVAPSTLKVPPAAYWDKMDKIADAQINRIHANGMMK